MDHDVAAIKIQAVFRGNKGRDRAVQELEALMEAELEYAVNKAQSLSQGKTKRKDNYSMDLDDPGDPGADLAGAVTEMGADLGPTPDTSKEAHRQHQIVADALNINNAEIGQKAMERVKQTAPGLYKKKDLIQHIKKLQDRVADIQNVVEAVVPVVRGDADPPGQMPLPTMATRNLRTTTNGRKLTDLKVAIFGLDGAGAIAAEMFARSGVGSLVIVDADCISKRNK